MYNRITIQNRYIRPSFYCRYKESYLSFIFKTCYVVLKPCSTNIVDILYSTTKYKDMVFGKHYFSSRSSAFDTFELLLFVGCLRYCNNIKVLLWCHQTAWYALLRVQNPNLQALLHLS